LTRKEFDINFDFIPNEEVKELLNSSAVAKKIFKILLASFRKKKKKAIGIFTKDVINQFNGTVDKINASLKYGRVIESEVPTFMDFLNHKQNEYEEDVLIPEESEELEAPVIIDEEPVEEPKKKVKAPATSKVNIIVGRFQPFHNGHLKMIKFLKEKNGFPTFIIVVHTGSNKSGKSPIDIDTQNAIMSRLHSDMPEQIAGFAIAPNAFLDDIVNLVRPDFEPDAWGAGADRISGFQRQIDYNNSRNNRLKLPEDFKMIETPRIESGTDVRACISDDNYSKFKTMVPHAVVTFWNQIKHDIVSPDVESN
jgi:cytidyltransferase-like protein